MKSKKMRVLFLSKHSKIASNVMRGKTVSKQLSSMEIKTSSITFKIFKIFKKYYQRVITVDLQLTFTNRA